MKSLVAATIITVLVAGVQVWSWPSTGTAQLNHEYESTDDQDYNPLGGGLGEYNEVESINVMMEIVQRFMSKAGFEDKWWILERVQVDPEGLVVFIMIEGKHRYALFIIDEHIVGVQKLQ